MRNIPDALSLTFLLSLVALAGVLSFAPCAANADQQYPEPSSTWPSILAAQYTFIAQNQSRLRSPYSGPLSLDPDGGTKTPNTMGIHAGWAPVNWGQLNPDVERFDGAGVSGATGLACLTNGDVVREGAAGIKKEFSVARLFTRFMLPLHDEVETVERTQDQVPGTEATTRVELKLGRMAVTDDFDQNRYAGSPRTQFRKLVVVGQHRFRLCSQYPRLHQWRSAAWPQCHTLAGGSGLSDL